MLRNKAFVLAVICGCGWTNAQEENKEMAIDSVHIRQHKLYRQSRTSSVLSKTKLDKSSGENLANILKQVSGVNVLQSGANISKPVIQGLTNQRISIINNGIKLESQLWGSDHAPEIDPFLAHQIEVIKGAEAVKYGSNALGGVVLLKIAPLPYNDKKLGGKIQLLGESNNEGWGGNLMLNGALKNFAWRVQGSGKKAGDYSTADYIVNNTGSRELNFSGTAGYKAPHEKAEIFYSYFSTDLGIYRGSRIGSVDDWELRLRLGRPPVTSPFTYNIVAPNQKVVHHFAKASVESDRPFGKTSLNYSYQRNNRQEYDMRTGPLAYKPVMDVDISTHTALLDYEKTFLQYFKTQLGASYSHQKNYNIPGTGVNGLLPNFVSNNAGVYIAEEFRKDSWIANAGIRYDFKDFSAAGYNRFSEYYGGQRTFRNLSYTVSINKNFGRNFSATTNVGMAWRAPEAVELFSNGLDHGSAFFIQGNENLKTERGLKWTGKLQYADERVTITAEGFLQKIQGFIYEMPTGEYKNTWGGFFPLFIYKQSDAILKGGDAEIGYAITPWMRYEGQFSAVYAENLTENYYFPNISPERFNQNIEFRLDRLTRLQNSWLKVEHLWVNKQKRFSPETDLLPDSPSAYQLLGASIGTDVSIFRKNDMKLSLQANNLLNKMYKDYTNRFRYFTHEMGRNIQFRMNFNF